MTLALRNLRATSMLKCEEMLKLPKKLVQFSSHPLLQQNFAGLPITKKRALKKLPLLRSPTIGFPGACKVEKILRSYLPIAPMHLVRATLIQLHLHIVMTC